MNPEEYVDKKELIASHIFDFYGKDYSRPHEQHCHEIAEQILNALGFYVEEF